MMNITYLGRKTTIKDSFKEYAEKRLKRLEKFFDDDPNVMIVVTNEGEEETVEVTIKSRGMFFRGEKASKDRQISLDLVVDVLSSQIVRNKNRLERRLKLARGPVACLAPDGGQLGTPGGHRHKLGRRYGVVGAKATVRIAREQIGHL